MSKAGDWGERAQDVFDADYDTLRARIAELAELGSAYAARIAELEKWHTEDLEHIDVLRARIAELEGENAHLRALLREALPYVPLAGGGFRVNFS